MVSFSEGYWYLATPYTKYPYGHNQAVSDAAYVAASLKLKGIRAYSPVVYCHFISVIANLDKTDHDFWMDFDYAMMGPAEGLIVAKMFGWTESEGVTEEIGIFRNANKPILYLECEDELQRRAEGCDGEDVEGPSRTARGQAGESPKHCRSMVCLQGDPVYPTGRGLDDGVA